MDKEIRIQHTKGLAEGAAQGRQRKARSQVDQKENPVSPEAFFDMALLRHIFRKPRLWLIVLAVLLILLEHTPLVSAGMIWSG